jgi:hypothetical protein
MESNEDNFYINIVDHDEIYNFLVLSFFSFEIIKMLKKINCLFRHEGIFDFSYPQFDIVRAKSDGSSVEGKRVHSSGTCENSPFLMACG